MGALPQPLKFFASRRLQMTPWETAAGYLYGILTVSLVESFGQTMHFRQKCLFAANRKLAATAAVGAGLGLVCVLEELCDVHELVDSSLGCCGGLQGLLHVTSNALWICPHKPKRSTKI